MESKLFIQKLNFYEIIYLSFKEQNGLENHAQVNIPRHSISPYMSKNIIQASVIAFHTGICIILLCLTRIVRESDYSPASQLFCRVKKKTMTSNYHKLDLINIDVHTKFGLIMSICSQDIERKRNSYLNKWP